MNNSIQFGGIYLLHTVRNGQLVQGDDSNILSKPNITRLSWQDWQRKETQAKKTRTLMVYGSQKPHGSKLMILNDEQGQDFTDFTKKLGRYARPQGDMFSLLLAWLRDRKLKKEFRAKATPIIVDMPLTPASSDEPV